ncbi:MAG: PSD1 and planctomycete cytochrome C domain-containing protein [Planctomycetota bacterium]|nr:PSD1 and planctomycete cytochrome C domain-containing protein [Planctomycetota bacterium]
MNLLKSKRQLGLLVWSGVSVWYWFFGIHPVVVADEIQFARDIQPILEKRCWDCHGEDQQESGLRLDLRANLLTGGDSGVAAMVPGEPGKSYLVDLISHLDPEMKMPPDEAKIPQREIDLISRWIREGAVWPGQMKAAPKVKSSHWSFQKIIRPPVPHSAYRSPVDSFLNRQLEANGIKFSPTADPRSLARRVSIVLTGLTPTPKTLESFLLAEQEDPETAYAQLVDSLLESPHFGERWAQHWLDVIRWAETNGSESNLYRKNAWIYRDYVVRAFNEDKPYDQFIREQLAGDSLGMGEATGFLVSGPHVPAATVGREPSAIRQARADRLDEILQTVGASILGVTIGCARCHNHKFDPLTIRDYYALTGVFQDVEFGSRLPEFSEDHPRRKRGEEIKKMIAQQRKKLRKLGGWEENWGAYRELHFAPCTTRAVRIRFKQPNVNLDELEIFGPKAPQKNLVHRRHGVQLSGFPEKGNDRRNPIERVNDGEFGTMTWRANVPKNSKERPWLQFDFQEPQTLERIRLSSNREYFYDTDYLTQKPWLPRYEFDVQVMTESGQWRNWIGTWFVNKQLNEKHPQRQKSLDEIQRFIEMLAEAGPRPSFVGRLVPPQPTRVLLRGSPESPRDVVLPAAPVILEGDLGLNTQDPGQKRRAAFGEWVTHASHPLTARVMVNRVWHHVFGRGIVSTTSDFGTAGAKPTHPELLDWLASEFSAANGANPTTGKPEVKKPWSIKQLVRLLVMSHAFRQSSQPIETALVKDARSQLLWRFPPKRVEAEVIRDSILQASGVLDRAIGGRGYRIHNVKKTYAQWEVVDNHGPQTWRRMIYQERMRRVDDQIFTAFDFPDCGQVRAKRPVSTTPLQALNLLNSDFVLDQSNRIAERATKSSDGIQHQPVDRCFQLLLGRSPTSVERDHCYQVAKAYGLAAVCRALINSNEFAFLP